MWSTTPPVPVAKPGWTTDPTIHFPPGGQMWTAGTPPVSGGGHGFPYTFGFRFGETGFPYTFPITLG